MGLKQHTMIIYIKISSKVTNTSTKGKLEQALVHDSIEPSSLWHRRPTHFHYIALPLVENERLVTRRPKILVTTVFSMDRWPKLSNLK